MTKLGSAWISTRLLLATALVAAPLTMGSVMAAEANLAGSWSGGGSVNFASGEKERARCRATFRRNSSRTYSMRATCSTPSGSVSQNAQITRISSTRFSGEFQNSEYGISGSIYISLRGNRLSASLVAGGGSANFSLSR
ncbi:MAG: hypothetical protein R3D68_03010 [Hyphomicrobiaceae bacterium]